MIFHDERGNIIDPQAELEKMKTDEFKRADYKFPDKYRPPHKKDKKETDATLSGFIKKHVEDRGGICDIYKAGGTFRKGKEQVIQKTGYFNVTLQKSKSLHTKSNATSGASDNHIELISINGMLISWKCENKLPGDKMSDTQLAYKNKIDGFGKRIKIGKSVYSVVTSREDFISQYNLLMSSL